jgi:hypothetical protein
MKTDKVKHHGDLGLSLVECIDTRLQQYLIRAFVSDYIDEEKKTKGITFRQFEYDYKPKLDEVLTDIIVAIPDEPITFTEIAQMAELLGEDPIEPMRTALLHNIETYDTSVAVNSFMLQGKEMWLPKETRVGLVNSITIEKAAGKETTVLWFDGEKYELPVDTALQTLSALELYALDCYNVTAAHKAAVSALASVEDIVAYDYTANYPSKLNF